ncbi:TolC family protein [Paraperlucidibaca sp.]|uniref:TolC family protein n=1 Tax=Paraperlucidibaca sp. TaxID=2708021 RepID=UPI0030F45261
MRFNAARLLCLAFALNGSLSSYAHADALSFNNAQQQALAYSRQLQAQDAAIRADSELVIAAGERPDPRLSVELQNLPANGSDRFSTTRDFMTMRMVGISQEFTRQNTLDLRQARQQQLVELAKTDKRLMQSKVLQGAGRAWVRAYFLQEQCRVLADELTQARLKQQASEAAYSGNRLSQADTLAAHAEVLLLEDQHQVLTSTLQQALFDLARWLGGESNADILLGTPNSSRTHLDGMNLRDHLLRHPDLVLLSQRIDLARTEADLAESAKSPDWTVSLSYAKRGSAFSDMMSVGVSVPLQWGQSRRQDREVASRLAQVEQAKATREDMLDRHVAEISGQLDRWRSNQSRARRYREQIIPLQAARAKAVNAQWRGGRAVLADVFAARRALLSTELDALLINMQVDLDWVDLEFLLPENAGEAS